MEKKSGTQVKIDDTLALTCVIENAQNTQGHTDYVIKVERETESSWTVIRRYSDFVTLHGCLQVSNIELPLPPKKVFGNMEREFVAERQMGLQNYLNAILANPMLASCLWIKRFLDPNNYSTNYQELSLQYVSMLIRSEPAWEVVEPMPRIGRRLRKEFFLVQNINSPKQKYLLSWSQIGPDGYLEDKDLQGVLKALTSLKHPCIYPTTFASASDNGGFIIQPLSLTGSLRDYICKAQLRHHFLRKYGNPKERCPLPLNDIRTFGRQILAALKFLEEKGFPFAHLHTGNLIIEGGVCRLTELHNQILGLPPYHRSLSIQLRKVNTIESLAVYSFGHVIYEMVFGYPLTTPTCDNFPQSCSPALRSLLESLLSTEGCKNGLPTVLDLIGHPFFADVTVPSGDRPSFKLSIQLKESLRAAKQKTEERIRQHQRVLRQLKRISKAQALLTQDDDQRKRKVKKKTPITNGMDDLRPTTPTTPTSTTSSTTSSVSPVPPIVSLAPPPPPPFSFIPPPPPDSSVGVTPTSGGNAARHALLGSIESFNKGGLRKAKMVDKSQPLIS